MQSFLFCPLLRISAFLSFSISLAAQPTPGSITRLPLGGGQRGAIVLDAEGNQYTTGSSGTSPFNPTPGAAQTKSGGGLCPGQIIGPFPGPPITVTCSDAYVQKQNSFGTVIFGTLLGGATADRGNVIAADNAGNTYVAGNTAGSFPTTAGSAIQSSDTSRTFAAKLNSDGSKFLYSTYLPDTVTIETAIGVDGAGNLYIGGSTIGNHAIVLKLSADGSTILFAKLLAGSNQESIGAMYVDGAGNAYVSGATSSPDFPTTVDALQTQLAGAQNAFVTKLDAAGNVVFSTLLGGSGSDQGTSIQIDSSGSVLLAGSTTSLDFPVTAGTFQPQPLVPAWGTSPAEFVAKLAADGSSMIWGSYIWSFTGLPLLALGGSGDVYVAGPTGNGFPFTPSAPMPCVPGSFDFSAGNFLLHLDQNGSLLDATYLDDPPLSVLTVATDGSVTVGGSVLSRVRFGGPGWVAPACMTQSIFNSATLSVAFASPGQLVSFFGFGIGPDAGVAAEIAGQGAPLSLGGVQVLFDGKPAPVYYAQSRQVNAQIPFEVAGQSSTTVTLVYNGVTYGSVTVEVEFAQPGLFRLQPNVSGLAYAVNEDRTFNSASNPALRGSIVELMGTGFGQTNSPCPTGGLNIPGPASLSSELAVQLLQNGTVQYAGSSPTLACGVTQINLQIPLDATPGLMKLNLQETQNLPNGNMSFVNPPHLSFIYVK